MTNSFDAFYKKLRIQDRQRHPRPRQHRHHAQPLRPPQSGAKTEVHQPNVQVTGQITSTRNASFVRLSLIVSFAAHYSFVSLCLLFF